MDAVDGGLDQMELLCLRGRGARQASRIRPAVAGILRLVMG